MESKIRLGLLDALRGTKVRLKLSGHSRCPDCGGQGHQQGSGAACAACHGTGQQNVGGSPLPLTGPCQACGGTGKERGPACSRCHGQGVINDPSTITVTVPPGVDNGSKIRLSGKGEPGLGGAPSGDLFLIVEVTPHPLLTRDGDNLTMTLPITVPEAVLGASVSVPLVEGEARVKIPPGSQTGSKLRLRGKGAPSRRGRDAGDLFLVLEVRLPESKSEELDAAAESMKELYVEAPRKELRL